MAYRKVSPGRLRRTFTVAKTVMIWFYERDKIALRLETRYDNKAAEYVAVLHHPDGRQELQRFSQLVAFRQWLLTLEETLAADRWTQKGSPDILPDGWPSKLPRM